MNQNNQFIRKKKAFTLIELLIVIAIIGILFIVLVSKVDFATDKAKAAGVQTDFRSFQLAFEQVAKENAGFNTFGWDEGDTNGDRVRNSYDEGDTNQDGVKDDDEVWTGHKVYTEEWTGIYTLVKPGTTGLDADVIFALESAINKNLDPKLHITIGTDGKISMANQARDPWGNEYSGQYISSATSNKSDRGSIVLLSSGPNGELNTTPYINDGKVVLLNTGNNVVGQDDYAIVTTYAFNNGYGEVSTSFNNIVPETSVQNPDNMQESVFNPSNPDSDIISGLYATNSNLQTVVYTWDDLVGMGIISNGKVVAGNESLLQGELVLDNSVTTLYADAFKNCINLTGVIIPTTTTSISGRAFNGCTNLSNLQVVEGNRYFYDKDNCIISSKGDLVLGCKTSNMPNDGTIKKIAADAFYNCKDLKTIIIPDSVISVESTAFYGCKFETVVFSENSKVSNIGSYAFYPVNGGGDLTKLYLPKTLTKLNLGAFYGCNIDAIYYGGSVEDWMKIDIYSRMSTATYGGGDFYFLNDSGEYELLENLVIPESISNISVPSFFGCESIKTITIQSHVTGITSEFWGDLPNLQAMYYDGTFISWLNDVEDLTPTNSWVQWSSKFSFYTKENGLYQHLQNVVIPNSITKIKNHAFHGMDITSVDMHDNVTVIGRGAFYGCNGLIDIKLSNSITILENYTFRECRNIKSLIIPVSVTEFGSEVFLHGGSGIEITLLSTTPPTIKSNTFFWNSDIKKLIVPAGTADLYKNDANWSAFASKIVEN